MDTDEGKNPKSETRNPKQIQKDGNFQNRKRRTGEFLRGLRTIWSIALQSSEAVTGTDAPNKPQRRDERREDKQRKKFEVIGSLGKYARNT
jgi:hypothetical protein